MDSNKKLVVPEINADLLTKKDKIIANPNCSTIQMVMALAPLHKAFNIKRIVISTYQSITGTGVKAVEQLSNEANGKVGDMAYPHPIYENALPQCDIFMENNYTKEEMKLVNETHKIFNDSSIGITATAIRIPVVGGHSESVNLEFENSFEVNEIRSILEQTRGVEVQDNPKKNIYPMPIEAKGKDSVFVGRIRRDKSIKNGLNLWIVSDNLRKGAATNTIQIAEYLIENRLV
jgi:aspartate-semialdehyde dehydrogenase